MVVVEADNERLGLIVDELLAQQQVVVKSLEANYGRVEGLAGATVIGEGAVSLILDVVGISRLTRDRQGEKAA
jgi:two-component system chemotaxis sensor kinase CheA